MSDLHSQTSTRVLLVEPDAALRAALEAVMYALAHVESHARFETARGRLSVASFDFLVANIRLGTYNGLHLVYLTAAEKRAPRAVVYSDVDDLVLAHEAQQIGAFYERRERLPITLAAYLRATLPERDRRDPAAPDRRGTFRGGRRCWDRHLADRAQ